MPDDLVSPARRATHVLLGVGVLLGLSLGGEVVVQAAGLPLPGSVLVLLILILVLLSPLGDAAERVIAPGGDLLVVMLPLLLVPLAVGVLDLIDAVDDAASGLIVSLVAGWLVTFCVTAALCQLFGRSKSRRDRGAPG